MLVKVSIENFKSFDSKTEFTMISSNKIRSHREHKIEIKGTALLKYAVIYGANASGKTNLVEFFRFFKECVRTGLSIESAKMFCKNKKENEERESSFEIQFTYNDKFYAYGFSAILSQRKFTGEWLYELFRNGSAHCLFERTGKCRPVLGDTIRLNEEEKNKFDIYAEDFAGNETFLFLSEMNHGKKYNEDSKIRFFQWIFHWIQKNIVVLTPNTVITNFEYYYNEKSLDQINRLIKTFDTGISEVKIEETSLDELSDVLPRQVFEEILLQIKSKITNQKKTRLSMRSDTNFFNVEVDRNQQVKVTTIRLHHGKSFFDFGFEDESDGTRRIFDLLDMILTSNDDMIFVVDELERSLHPKLTEHFLKLFMQAHDDDKVQLLFTTHESSIMDQSLFRRDEIWFVERDSENSSNIYSLDRFKERYDKILSKSYLEGRYGAIPIFSSFEYEREE